MTVNIWRKSVTKITILFYTALTPLALIYADSNCDPAGGKICNPINSNNITTFIQTFLTGALKIGTPVVALAIIYSGFLFVAARGNTEKLTKAKETLMYTLIGAAILLGSWAIATLIVNTVQSL